LPRKAVRITPQGAINGSVANLCNFAHNNLVTVQLFRTIKNDITTSKDHRQSNLLIT
jgi:hypothetical protein